jgi:hypothetical protein
LRVKFSAVLYARLAERYESPTIFLRHFNELIIVENEDLAKSPLRFISFDSHPFI